MNANGNGGSNGFKPDEIVMVHSRPFPVVGGKLRILHELHQEKLSIETELVDYIFDQYAVVRARITTATGTFSATGTASAARDPKLADSLLCTAETRACARAARLAGVGVETCGFEELGDGALLEPDQPRQELRAVPAPGGAQPTGGNGHASRGMPATTAQRRALHSLARQLGEDLEVVVAKAFPGIDPERLSLRDASALIDKMKAKAGNGASVGR